MQNNRLQAVFRLRLVSLWVIALFFAAGQARVFASPLSAGTDVNEADSVVYESIYPPISKNKSAIYKWLWGTHYLKLYTIPVAAQAITLDSFSGGVQVVDQIPYFHGLLLANNRKQLYMLRPLGGSTSFMESDFFREVYNRKEFESTYLDQFIKEAYTIINPFTFISADYMAKKTGLNSTNSRIYYIDKNSTRDTIVNGSDIQGKLVSITDVPDLNTKQQVITTEQLLQDIQRSKLYVVNQPHYIRERLFDMLIGDWNKIPENWNWQITSKGDSIFYNPMVIDRNHAFTKVDGILFKEMLQVLSLGFIVDYNGEFKDLKKINKLGFALDMALTSQSDESVWLEEARFLKENLTDQLIEEAFAQLPSGIDSIETGHLKLKLRERREKIGEVAHAYFTLLQRTPVIAGTKQDDYFRVDRYDPDSLRIRIYSPESQSFVFDRKYGKKETNEIWLYGLEGNDRFEVNGRAEKEPPVYFISGPGDNHYQVEPKSNIRIYAYKPEREKLDSISHTEIVLSDEKSVHKYDYQKIKYHETSFTPWGVYDSDQGFSLGAYFTYTMYGYKRAPFTYRHRIGYNYRDGLMYQGVFPDYGGKKSFYLDALIGSPTSFYNFFGFGNSTDGNKDEKNNFSRVNIREFSLTPSFHLDMNNSKSLVLYTSLEMFKVKRPDDRFINQFYPDDYRIFKTNYFVDLGATFQMGKKVSSLISDLEGTISAGWTMNIKNPGRNFPYTNVGVSMDLNLTRRFTLATMAKGTVLFNNKYEFYQSATTELRGFRDNRFIGKQSFYQCTDFRVDMGKIHNPFTPLKYGLFVGFDYGRVWFPHEQSKNWHTSYGGGVWLTLFDKFTTKYSWFGATDSFRFMFELGLGF